MFFCMLMLSLAWGLRETQVESYDRKVKKFKVPRKCDGWKWDSSKCCSCGPRNGEKVDMELETVVKTCELVKGDTVEGAYCCPVWAVDCKEDEPEFFKGLQRDCPVTEEDCYEAQCYDAKQTLDSAKQTLMKLRKETPKEQTYEEKGHITGKSGAFQMCPCGCGELDAATMTCSLVEKTIFCKKPQTCCSNLKDCEPSDPWPKAAAARVKGVLAGRRKHREQVKQLETEVEDLAQLLKECVSSCKVTQQQACLEDLKEEVELPGKWFGDKKVSRQEANMEDYYTKLHQKATASEQERQAWINEAQEQEKKRQKALNQKRKEKWRKETYVNLQNFVAGATHSLSEKVRSKECCKCSMQKSTMMGFGTTFITDFCSAPSCSVYEGMCSPTSKSFCGKRYTACPADPAYYAKGGD